MEKKRKSVANISIDWDKLDNSRKSVVATGRQTIVSSSTNKDKRHFDITMKSMSKSMVE
jgi:hypothetical protein